MTTQTNRVYIASSVHGTVHIADRVPADSLLSPYPLGTQVDEGPSVDNRRPPKIMATQSMEQLQEHPFRYTRADCAFLSAAGFGTWQKQVDGSWEQIRVDPLPDPALAGTLTAGDDERFPTEEEYGA